MILVKDVACMENKKTTHQKLEKLMLLWEGQHIAESESVQKKIKRFAPDGLIGVDDEWDSLDNKNKTLYICAAPNMEKDDYRKCFWVQEVVDGLADKNGKIIDRMAVKQYEITYGDKDDLAVSEKIDIGLELLKNAAFMNLCKRGCSDRQYDKRLKDYVDKYKRLIKKEIEILNPDIIFCYGKGVSECVNVLLSEMNICPKVFEL